MALKPSRREVVGMVRDKLERHLHRTQSCELDWTCAVQAVAMEIAWNEQESLEDLAPDFEGENQ